jgi:flagellar basal body rod protein FlgG
MSDGIYSALSGAIAQSTLLETAANNLANASTDGYQRVRPVFQEMLSRAGGGAAAGGPTLVTVAATAVDTSAGAVRPTGRQLDAALPEGVYLAVSTPRGERYTRAVSLTVDPEGGVKTARGDVVADESGAPLRVAPGAGELSLTADGELRRAGTPAGTPAVRLRLVRFDRPDRLVQEGGTLLAARGATPTVAAASLTVGSVEESNATMVGAMTDLVTATRTFDAFQRVIDAFREADRRVVTSVPG